MGEKCTSARLSVCLYLGDDDASINVEVGFPPLTCLCSDSLIAPKRMDGIGWMYVLYLFHGPTAGLFMELSSVDR